MPFTFLARNVMLDAIARAVAPAQSIDRVGAFDADPGKSVTATAAGDLFTSAAHGYANGNLVVFSGMTGGAGIKAGDPYFVIGVTANTFQVAKTVGGAAVDVTSDMSAGTVIRLVELTGGAPAYARKAIAWNAAADGTIDDSTNGAVLDVPAGATVDFTGYWNNSSGSLLAIAAQTPEVFAAQGTYTVTDADLDLNQ